MRQNQQLLVVALHCTLLLLSYSIAQASVLTGSGPTPFPGNTGPPVLIGPDFVDSATSFTGQWKSPAGIPWRGIYTATGMRPMSGAFTGTTLFDFSGLTNGVLPTNTHFVIGDLDRGSVTSETIVFKAFDSNNMLLQTPWLNEPSFQWGEPAIQLASMLPSFTWDAGAGTYTFDGNGETFSGNPATAFTMFNNTPILRLEVTDNTPFASYGLAAPEVVPEPSSVVLWLAAILVFYSRTSGIRNGIRTG